MAIPPSATFRYIGVVPQTKAARASGQWQLEDESGAAPSWKFWKWNRLLDYRLVGLQPTLRISGDRLVLEARGRHRSSIRSASLELDPSCIESLQGGDVITLVRTGTTDIGVSIVRGGRLMLAAGAVTAIPLGDEVVVRGGPVVDFTDPEQWPRRDPWVEVSVSGEVRRLRGGEETTIGAYRFSVVRCFQDGDPGTHESIAITFEGILPHDAAMNSAELLARPHSGLIQNAWA